MKPPSLSLPLLLALLLASPSFAQLLSGPSTTSPAPNSSSSSSAQESKSSSSTSTADTSSQTSISTSSTTSSQTSSSTSTTATQTSTASSSTTQTTVTSTSNGIPLTVTVTSTGASSSTSAVNTGAAQSGGDSSGLGVGPIIGMSVAGGIAVIGIIAFVIWKMTRKRFSDFDDNEAIKWPELNSHGNPDPHPLPVHNTGRAGFDTASEASLSRVDSSNYSTPDFMNGSGPDPYAVPPLPHLNPNQPYRDDPSGHSGYYDPYRGPVPGTLENDGTEWSGEAIPMTHMNATTRTMSPAPSANFVNDGGRQSPAPHLAYQGRVSPGPQAAFGGPNYDVYGSR